MTRSFRFSRNNTLKTLKYFVPLPFNVVKNIIIRLRDEDYEFLKKEAERENFQNLEDYIKFLILKIPRQKEQEVINKEDLIKIVDAALKSSITDKLASDIAIKLERKIEDILNPYTAKVDEIIRKLAELNERFEVSKDFKEAKPIQQVQAQKKRTAMDWLKDQGILYESDIRDRLNNPESFFAKLEREGAKIIEFADDKVAIYPEVWEDFINKLKEIKTNNESELRNALGDLRYRLFVKLKNSGQVYYNASEKRWYFTD